MSSFFEIKLSRVPWRSMLGAIVFSVFLNDLYLCLTDSDSHNCADANAIPVKNLNDLLQTLEKKTIANTDKFQTILLVKLQAPRHSN